MTWSPHPDLPPGTVLDVDDAWIRIRDARGGVGIPTSVPFAMQLALKHAWERYEAAQASEAIAALDAARRAR